MAKHRPSTTQSSARALAETDLARSGLTWSDAEQLGMEVWEADRTKKELGYAWRALCIPYFDAYKRRRKDVYRVRLLGTQPGPFGTTVCPPMRYLQPKNTVPAVYIPPNTAWQPTMQDVSTTIWLTEGEKKAAKACKAGIFCLGLGGVWSFMSKRLGVELLPELKEIVWHQRQVAICFDSDVMVKPDVAKAVVKLTEVLIKQGALVRTVTLPEGTDHQKVGLDDYLVTHDVEELQALLGEAPASELAAELWRFNARYAVIHHPSMIYDTLATDDRAQPQPKPLSANHFTQVVAADRQVTVTEGEGKSERRRKVQVAQEWLRWPVRQCYEALTYEPGKDLVLNSVVTPRLNGWRGLACEPAKGSVAPWTKLLDYLFTGAEPEALVWFERWCGYPIKHLGTKLLSAVGVWSNAQGQGKTLVGTTLGAIYGSNYISIPQRMLDADHNPWALNRQFVLVDDISSHDTRSTADLLKKFITQTDMNINIKFISQFTVPDHINYLFTSNQGDAFYIDEHDRRFFIHEVKVQRMDLAWYRDYYDPWLKGPGPAALLHYFQHELDYGDFEPSAPPPFTKAKQEMVEGVRSELDTWLASLKNLDLMGRDLWTASELCGRFNGAAVHKTPVNAFGRRLTRQYPCVGLVDTGKASRERFYAIANAEKWLKASNKERAAHVQSTKRF